MGREQGITIKISDDAEKIRERDDVVIGEVRSKTTQETKRKKFMQQPVLTA